MSLRDVVAKDQEKVFGDMERGFAEAIDVRDTFGGWHTVAGIVEREQIEAATPAGYATRVGRQSLFVWIPFLFPVAAGISRVRCKWRQVDDENTEFAVVAVLPQSENCWRLECVK